MYGGFFRHFCPVGLLIVHVTFLLTSSFLYLPQFFKDIGDISDEGQKTTFSASEAGAADSLLDKLNLGLDNGTATDDSAKSESDKQTQPQEKVTDASK